MKKFNYKLEIEIFRSSTQNNLGVLRGRVLARISKMPVQNSKFKISARPDLATNLLQILIPATINSLVCQRGQFTLQLCHRSWFVRKIFGYYFPKVKLKKSSQKYLPVQAGGFYETTCPKDRQDRCWLSPC